MAKHNFISKYITLLLFTSILVFSTSFKKEIPLRNLDTSTFSYVAYICLNISFGVFYITVFFESCSLCCDECKCEDEDEHPNKYTFLYFSLIGKMLILTAFHFLNKETDVSYLFFIGLGMFVISSIIYIVKSCQNPKNYCSNICTAKYLKDLASYPIPIYCVCAFICCSSEEKEICACIYMSIIALFYIVGTAIEYYLFLLIYMFLMLLTQIFTCSLCNECDCDCDDCSCCCECCSKKNKQKMQIKNQDDAHIITLRAEAVFIDSHIVINESTDETNNEIEEENDYKNKKKILIKTLTGKIVELYLDDNDTILDVKKKICEKEGIPIEEQRLIFQGRQLEDNKTIEYYNISNESTLQLVLKLLRRMKTIV